MPASSRSILPFLVAGVILAVATPVLPSPQQTPQQQELQREREQAAERQRQAAEREAEQQRQRQADERRRQAEQERQRQAEQERQRQPDERRQEGERPQSQGGSTRTNPQPGTTYSPRGSGATATASRPGTVYTPHGGSSSNNPAGSTSRTGGGVVYTPHRGGTSATPATSTGLTPQHGVTAHTPQSPALTPGARSAATPVPSPGASSTRPQTALRTLPQINAARATMHGINQRALPPGVVSHHSDGGMTVKTESGREYAVRANGTLRSYASTTQKVTFRSNGRVESVRKGGTDIWNGPYGQRITVTHRADHSVLVSTAPHRGYLERTIASGERRMIQRTYFVDGSLFTRLYLGYAYGGYWLPLYVPGVYYPGDFYGWAYYGWPVPVAYAWGWDAAPWYSTYPGYLTPYAYYASGYAWLTDYILARTLAEAEAERQQSYADSASGEAEQDPDDSGADDSLGSQAEAPITPELKDQIAAEVQRQLAYESAEAGGTAQPSVGEFPAPLQPNRIFVAASLLDVATADQQSCALTPGDVLQLLAAPDGSGTAPLRVASSHRGDCPAGTTVTLSVTDLQEMQNNLRAQLDAGLGALRAGQGANGLPSAPAGALGAAQPAPFGPSQADADVGPLLDAQQQVASHTQTAAVRAVFAPN